MVLWYLCAKQATAKKTYWIKFRIESLIMMIGQCWFSSLQYPQESSGGKQRAKHFNTNQNELNPFDHAPLRGQQFLSRGHDGYFYVTYSKPVREVSKAEEKQCKLQPENPFEQPPDANQLYINTQSGEALLVRDRHVPPPLQPAKATKSKLYPKNPFKSKPDRDQTDVTAFFGATQCSHHHEDGFLEVYLVRLISSISPSVLKLNASILGTIFNPNCLYHRQTQFNR